MEPGVISSKLYQGKWRLYMVLQRSYLAHTDTQCQPDPPQARSTFSTHFPLNFPKLADDKIALSNVTFSCMYVGGCMCVCVSCTIYERYPRAATCGTDTYAQAMRQVPLSHFRGSLMILGTGYRGMESSPLCDRYLCSNSR
jgi:hypothetical protein